jgi:hypothetical protein
MTAPLPGGKEASVPEEGGQITFVRRGNWQQAVLNHLINRFLRKESWKSLNPAP